MLRFFEQYPCHQLLHRRQPKYISMNNRLLFWKIDTCLLSSHGVATVVTKNCEPRNRHQDFLFPRRNVLPLVFLPALAIESKPSFVCLSWKLEKKILVILFIKKEIFTFHLRIYRHRYYSMKKLNWIIFEEIAHLYPPVPLLRRIN
jgi:hypothetical protein